MDNIGGVHLTSDHSDDTFHSFTQVNDDRFVRDSCSRNQQGSISLSLYSKPQRRPNSPSPLDRIKELVPPYDYLHPRII